MGITRYTASADNTIVNAYQLNLRTRGTGANAGASDVLETFSIYGRINSSSQELSRILIKFPVSTITSDRTAGTLPASGNVDFYLKLHNAKHSRTVPTDYKLRISTVVSGWEEGVGLDLEGYKDLVRTDIGSNWMQSKKDYLWASYGGDYNDASEYGYDATFNHGLEDLEVKITPLVEKWIAGTQENYGVGIRMSSSYEASSSAAYITVAGTGGGTGGGAGTAPLTASKITITDFYGNSKNYIFVADSEVGASPHNLNATGSNVVLATRLAAAIDVIHSGTITVDDNGAGRLTLTQTGAPAIGNITFSITNNDTDLTFASSTNPDSVVMNVSGATKSYYTKRFFGRNTQYFFKRPYIEARWDSSTRDDRGNFFFSSSRAPAADNLNTIYFYNMIRGRLANLPGIGSTYGTDDSAICVSLFSGSKNNSTPSGSALSLCDSATVVTGGWVSTGIYSCSVCIPSSTIETLYDVWFKPDESAADAASASKQYYTGSIQPQVHKTGMTSIEPTYFINITNLKNGYFRKDKARLNLYVREKNWRPTIYTYSNTDIESIGIRSASYGVERMVDNKLVIPYGTGSNFHTGLSYNVSGNYFDFDMSLLEAGYSYAFRFVFYDDRLNAWVEQDKKFRFRVEEN